MTKLAEPSTPSGSVENSTTKATDHALQKYDNFTRYGHVRRVVDFAFCDRVSIEGDQWLVPAEGRLKRCREKPIRWQEAGRAASAHASATWRRMCAHLRYRWLPCTGSPVG